MANLNSEDRAKGASTILLIAAIIFGFWADSEWGWLAGAVVAVALFALAWVIRDPSHFRDEPDSTERAYGQKISDQDRAAIRQMSGRPGTATE